MEQRYESSGTEGGGWNRDMKAVGQKVVRWSRGRKVAEKKGGGVEHRERQKLA